MKIEELTIGDWVNFCGNRYKVEYVDARGEEPHHRIALRNDDGYYIGSAYSIEPITITPEILEKNGFKIEIADYTPDWKRCILNPNFFLEDRLTGCYRVNGNYLAKIEYVHELQHALRLYKIDKEIKL